MVTGWSRDPGPPSAGKYPANFFIAGVNITKELSVFVDESGNFGRYDVHAPFYIFTLVFHDQSKPIDDQLHRLEGLLLEHSMPSTHCFHVGPLIRREEEYIYMSVKERRQLLGLLVSFARTVEISYTSFCVEKRMLPNSSLALTVALSKKLSDFIRDNYDFFLGYDRIVLYYDNGQIELTRILASVFSAMLSDVEFRKVIPSGYRLFQVADMFCTLELVEQKAERKALSKSERLFFTSERDLKKNYLKPMHRLRFMSNQ